MVNPGTRIRELREKREMSQLELARQLGINNSVLSRIESGKRDVEDYLLVKFADFFRVSTDYLLYQTNDPTPTSSADLPETVAPYLADGLRELTPEARKEVMDFIEYVKVKYAKKDGDDKK